MPRGGYKWKGDLYLSKGGVLHTNKQGVQYVSNFIKSKGQR